MPVAAVAISPWTDLTCSSDSYRTKNRVSVRSAQLLDLFSKLYVGDNQAGDPFISPLFGALHGLPPIFINSGTDDELYEDGEKFYLKASDTGVNILFRAGIGQVHCYPFFLPLVQGSKRSHGGDPLLYRTTIELWQNR